jgi:hypothetical protein
MKKPGYTLAVVAVLLGLETRAWANNPPGPFEALPTIFMLPLVAWLSLAGGYYSIRKRRAEGKAGLGSILPAVAALLVFLSMAHEGIGLLLTLGFSALALGRAVTMIRWGVLARRRSAPSEIAEIGPRRLLAAGAGLVAATALLGPMPLAFRNSSLEQTWEHNQGLALWQYAEYQLGYARWRKEKTGRVSYDLRSAADAGFGTYLNAKDGYLAFGLIDPRRAAKLNEWREAGAGPAMQVDRDGKGFTLRLNPGAKFRPFFPYSILFWEPSWRADESGRVWITRRGKIWGSEPALVESFGDEDKNERIKHWSKWLAANEPPEAK